MFRHHKSVYICILGVLAQMMGCVQKKKNPVVEQEEDRGTVVSGGTISNRGTIQQGVINPIDSQSEEPLNFAASYHLTTQEAIHKLSLKLTGRPSLQSLKAHPEILNGSTVDDLSKAFDELTDPIGGNSDQFAEWVLTVLRDQWRIQVVRNDGINEWSTWRMDPTPEIILFNQKYLTRRPDRIFFDPENPGIFGGDGFDVPPSTFDTPGDAGYALYELEPLLFGAYLVIEDRPFGKVVDSSETVRSNALQDFAAAFTAENPQWNPSGSILNHWSGVWKHGERRRPDGSLWGGGILSTIGFLRTYMRERTWVANGIYRGMLCQNISEAPVPPQSVKLEKQGDPNPLLNGGSCKGCHNMLDGLSNLRMEYGVHTVPNWIGWASAYYPAHYSRILNLDFRGKVSLPDMNNHQQGTLTRWPMTHYLLKEDGSYAGVESMSQLGAILATMPRFHRCQVSAFVDALVQTSSLEDKEKLYQQALDAYYASNQSIKAALKAVVLSEVFNGRPH